MDTISALSVAAAAVQFVEFSYKCMNGVVDAYRSIDEKGAPAAIEALKTNAERMHSANSQLLKNLNPGTLRRELTGTENTISAIAMECVQFASTILVSLKDFDFKPADEPTWLEKWLKLRKAIKSVWSKEKLELLQRKLKASREELLFVVVLGLRADLQTVVANQASTHHYSERLSQMEGTILAEIGSVAQWQKNLDSTLKDIVASRSGLPRPSACEDRYLNFVSWSETALANSIFNQLLSSLKFEQMSLRQDRVAAAHRQTFQWIFSAPTQNATVWHSFTDWLENNDPIYWITGKAGSGKSTLMKFILSEPQTRERLQLWSGQNSLIVSSYFFWLAGSQQLQHSQEGFLRSLLHQTLEKLMAVAPSAASELWNSLALFKDLRTPWNWEDLVAATRLLLADQSNAVNYCFFIDGLDELKGNPRVVISFIQEICQYPNVKICMSSRPLITFSDQFRDMPHLQLEDLTRNDIKSYATSKLAENVAFKEFEILYQGNCLITEIANKAQGVFLWVVLVVLSLEDGLREGDRLSDIRKKLDAFPPELDDLFRSILHDFEGRLISQASALFQMVKAAPIPLTLLCLSLADEENTEFALLGQCQPALASARQRYYRALNMRRRLDSRCKGLLEVETIWMKGNRWPERTASMKDDAKSNQSVDSDTPKHCFSTTDSNGEDLLYDAVALRDVTKLPPDEGDLLAYSHVEYLHRTVKDFLDQPDVWGALLAVTEKGFEPNLALARSYLLQLKCTGQTDPKFTSLATWNLFFWTIEYCVLAEARASVDIELLDDLECWTRPQFRSRPQPTGPRTPGRQGHWPNNRKDDPCDFLHLAVQCGLVSYIRQKLSSTRPKDRYIESLLDTAVNKCYISFDRPSGLTFECSGVNIDLVKLLLDHSAMLPEDRNVWLQEAEDKRLSQKPLRRISSYDSYSSRLINHAVDDMTQKLSAPEHFEQAEPGRPSSTVYQKASSHSNKTEATARKSHINRLFGLFKKRTAKP